MNDVELFYLVE